MVSKTGKLNEQLSDRVVVENNDRDKIIESFSCPVCSDLIFDLRECSQCRNSFCKECIDKWQV